MTNTEFREWLKTEFGMKKNSVGQDYRIKGLTPMGGGHKWNYDVFCLITVFERLGYTTGAEIGVYEGLLSERLCGKFSGTIYLVDPWKRFPNTIYPEETTNGTQEVWDERYNRTVERLSKYENSVIIRKTSVEALSDIENNSLDFVYLDGNHEPSFVWHDLRGWWPKIKNGGIFSGHDFCLVNEPLVEFCVEKKTRLFIDAGSMPVKLIPYCGGYIYWRDEDWFIWKE